MVHEDCFLLPGYAHRACHNSGKIPYRRCARSPIRVWARDWGRRVGSRRTSSGFTYSDCSVCCGNWAPLDTDECTSGDGVRLVSIAVATAKGARTCAT
jgi:hypothetical protein